MTAGVIARPEETQSIFWWPLGLIFEHGKQTQFKKESARKIGSVFSLSKIKRIKKNPQECTFPTILSCFPQISPLSAAATSSSKPTETGARAFPAQPLFRLTAKHRASLQTAETRLRGRCRLRRFQRTTTAVSGAAAAQSRSLRLYTRISGRKPSIPLSRSLRDCGRPTQLGYRRGGAKGTAERRGDPAGSHSPFTAPPAALQTAESVENGFPGLRESPVPLCTWAQATYKHRT